MQTREQVVEFIKMQFEDPLYDAMGFKNQRHHYGLQDIKDLMDFIYEGSPLNVGEFLKVICTGTTEDYDRRPR